MIILVLNAGSSSIKFQLYGVADGTELTRRLKGQIDGIGTNPRLVAKDRSGLTVADERLDPAAIDDVPAALDQLRHFLRDDPAGASPDAVGHRVVHGGPRYSVPVLVDDAVLADLDELVSLAPLHQPNNLAPIRRLRERNPDIPQVACFDTAFHRHHPELADRFALPEELYDSGIRRYGFHGLSYEFIASRLPELAPEIADGRVIVAHLGSGASLCALKGRRSVDSTMGFTALDGIPMGTRPGQLDPGVVLYLLAEKGMAASAVEHLLYHDCGLRGLSGLSNDMRDLRGDGGPRAKLAIDYFTYRIAREIGALAAVLEGLDGIVFTAGIGENDAATRAEVGARMRWLGLELDEAANAANARCISRPGSRIAAHVIPTNEERMIAKHTLNVLQDAATAAR